MRIPEISLSKHGWERYDWLGGGEKGSAGAKLHWSERYGWSCAMFLLAYGANTNGFLLKDSRGLNLPTTLLFSVGKGNLRVLLARGVVEKVYLGDDQLQVRGERARSRTASKFEL